MRIKIDAEGRRFTIPVPTGLVMNNLTARIIGNSVRKHANVQLTGEQLRILFRELKQAKRVFPGLTLVEVKSADNDRVLITL